MKKGILLVIALAVTLIAAACSPAPTPTPTQPPPPLPPTPRRATATAVPPTATAVPPTATTAPPTVAPQATSSTAQATSAATAAPATATPVPPTVAASPTPTLLAPPGLYVTSMRLDPPQPVHGQATSFFVTFLNTASTVNNQKWQVYVYRADNPSRRLNETTVVQTPFDPGSVELKALGSFQIGATGNACDYFFARVVTLDPNNKGIELTKPEGPVFDKGFVICQ